MDFSEALLKLKANGKICRNNWRGKAHLVLQTNVIYIVSTGTYRTNPWLTTQMDILASDWEIVQAP